MTDVELNDCDRQILTLLQDGRNTPINIARTLDFTREYISQRLKRLHEHGLVNRVGRGLYELSDGATVGSPTSESDQDPIETADIPGSGENLQRRQEALRTMYDHLREHGSATKEELLELVDPEAVGYASRNSFWSNAVKGRDTLRALPGVESPGEGGLTWRYVEPD